MHLLAAGFAVLALVVMAATSPRSTMIVLVLGVMALVAWWTLAPEPKYENQSPPRVMAP